MQTLKFKNVKWPEITKETPGRLRLIEDSAHYECEECASKISDHDKQSMLRSGEWRAKGEPMEQRKIAFRLNSLYSPWVKFGKMATEFLRSKKEPEKLQNFVNSWLGEVWVQRISTTSESEIMKTRCELPQQVVPREAVALTCGIDVQRHGFWFPVRAWARDYTSWLIHYGQLPSWGDAEEFLFNTWRPVFESEKHMQIWRAGVDTGGSKRESA